MHIKQEVGPLFVKKTICGDLISSKHKQRPNKNM